MARHMSKQEPSIPRVSITLQEVEELPVTTQTLVLRRETQAIANAIDQIESELKVNSFNLALLISFSAVTALCGYITSANNFNELVTRGFFATTTALGGIAITTLLKRATYKRRLEEKKSFLMAVRSKFNI